MFDHIKCLSCPDWVCTGKLPSDKPSCCISDTFWCKLCDYNRWRCVACANFYSCEHSYKDKNVKG